MGPTRRAFFTAPATVALSRAAAQEDAPPAAGVAPGVFIEVASVGSRAPVRVAAAQVVRVARVEGHTIIDTTAYVQQRTVESVEVVARRLAAVGQRLVALTDLANARTYLAADRVVLVREAYEQHAAGARAAIVMVGLRFNTDVAVRETMEEVMAVLGRAAARQPGPPEGPAAGAVR